jgi:hypothetical protein
VDLRTGKKVKVYAFVMTLCFSRMHFVDVVFGCDQRSWVASHVAAFEFFGGTPRQLRMDNLKTGVLRADIYDPQLNRAYAELGAHYGVLLDPCRQGKPKDKPRVERAVPYVRDSFWRGRGFSGLSDMKGAALGWCTGVAPKRPHRYRLGRTGTLTVSSDNALGSAATRHRVDPSCGRGWTYSLVKGGPIPWSRVDLSAGVRRSGASDTNAAPECAARPAHVHEPHCVISSRVTRTHGARSRTGPAGTAAEGLAAGVRSPIASRRRACTRTS